MAARADTACRDPDNASDSNGLQKVATAPPGLRIYIQLIIQNEVFGILRPCKIDTCQVCIFLRRGVIPGKGSYGPPQKAFSVQFFALGVFVWSHGTRWDTLVPLAGYISTSDKHVSYRKERPIGAIGACRRA